MNLNYAGKTDVGVKRTHNEDNLMLYPEENLFVVADGMGGHSSGEVASKMAVETVKDFFSESAKDEDMTWPYKMDKRYTYMTNRLMNSIKLANLRIFEAAQEDVRKKGMGTTVVSIFFHDSKAYTAHAGDSRCYRVREGKIDQITEDHSLLNDYKKMTQLTQEEIDNFPHKNVIVRALGMKEVLDVEINQYEPKKGDIYCLCSDGLSGEVEDDQILDIIMKNRHDLDKACDALIKAACEHGGKDNITAILVEYRG